MGREPNTPEGKIRWFRLPGSCKNKGMFGLWWWCRLCLAPGEIIFCEEKPLEERERERETENENEEEECSIPCPLHSSHPSLSSQYQIESFQFRLWRRPVKEPPLLRGPAFWSSPLQPACPLARPLRPHRRPRARGGLGGRVL